MTMLIDMPTFPTQPKLHKHHGGHSWTSYWRDDFHKMHVKRFGREGEMTARQARATFQLWIEQEWKEKESIRNPAGTAASYSCTRLASQYLRYAHRTFRKHGQPTSHVTQVRYAMRALRDHSGRVLAEMMDSPRLAEIRDWMIRGVRVRLVDGVEREERYKRSITTVNGRLLIMKEAFGWARERGRVPRPVLLDLQTVKPLARGRSEGLDPETVRPIAMDVVQATLPHCSGVVAAMIMVNVYTGARPGEVCIMRGCDLQMIKSDCWLYTPGAHKTEHHGIQRQIALGPKAVAIIRPFLQADTQAYLFSPAASRAQHDQAKSETYAALRIEKGVKGAARRDEEEADGEDKKRLPGRVYNHESYRKAVHYACKKAGIEPWNPNQLRHTHATQVREVFGVAGLEDAGLEAARQTLGHQDGRTSQIYAEESMQRAMMIARRVG